MRKAFDANVPKLRPRLKTGAPGAAPERNGVAAAADEAAEVSAGMQAAVEEETLPASEATEAVEAEQLVQEEIPDTIPTRAAASRTTPTVAATPTSTAMDPVAAHPERSVSAAAETRSRGATPTVDPDLDRRPDFSRPVIPSVAPP